ncbi:TMEM175 family protein [Actinopolymorpha sp. B17G11]|uniref:TMEM175 family protein n=1 Tax=Actinopolymorpha sp. B17G11 TaxID=3160861 RepID=UPI0032E51241
MGEDWEEQPAVTPGGIGAPLHIEGTRVVLPVERVFAIVDAVVAIAMTIILLDIRITPGLDDGPLREELYRTVPDLWAFALSVVVIGLFWRHHHMVMRHAARIDAPLLWLNFAFIAMVSLIPFPTSVLEDYVTKPVGPTLYAIVIAALASVLVLMWLHLTREAGPAHAPITGTARLRPLVMQLIVVIVFLASIPVALSAPALAPYVWLAVPLLSVIAVFLLRRHDRASQNRASQNRTRQDRPGNGPSISG